MRYEISKVVKKRPGYGIGFINCKPERFTGRHFILQGQVISAYHPDAVRWKLFLEDERYPMDTVESIFTVSSS